MKQVKSVQEIHEKLGSGTVRQPGTGPYGQPEATKKQKVGVRELQARRDREEMLAEQSPRE